MSAFVQWVAVLGIVSLAAVSCQDQKAVSCDMSKIASQPMDWNLVQGPWFLKMRWAGSPAVTPYKANLMNLAVTSAQGKTDVFWQEISVKAGSTQCVEINGTMEDVNGPVAPLPLPPAPTAGFIAFDRSVLAMWVELGPLAALSIYSRLPMGLPDLSNIQTQLTDVCGPDAADAFSGVYNQFLCYEDTPACFSSWVAESGV